MTRALALGLALFLSACGASSPLVFRCAVTPEDYTPGVPVAARLSLENPTTDTVTVLGMTAPWTYRHAARFSATGYEDPHVIADPGEYETLVLLPGETAGGEVALSDRLVDSFGRSLTEIPGTHEVSVRARLTLDPDSSRTRTVESTCTFPVTIPERASP